MRKAYKYRMYPNKTTKQQLTFVLDRCTELYNAALQERKEAYRYVGKRITYYDQQNDLPEIKQLRPAYLDIGSHVLQNVLKRLDNAFLRFFERRKRGEKAGYPRFQGRARYDSFGYPDAAGWKLKGDRLTLTKLGTIRVRLPRPVAGTIKTCTIKREGEHWYVTFSCEVEAYQRSAYTDEMVGIDLGTYQFAALSTGDSIETPSLYRKAEKKIQKLHQACARKKNKRSHRRKKADKKLSKAYRKLRNQRKDCLHQWSRILVDTSDTLVFEDLKTKNMVRRPNPKQDEKGAYLPHGAAAKGGLNKSSLDAGWNEFVELCSYKAACAGRDVLKVNPHKSSQICSGCGVEGKHKDLSERWHSCDCGTELDRDVNAAINIRALGHKQLTGGKHPTRAIA